MSRLTICQILEYKDTQCYEKEKCEPDGDYRPEGAEKQCGFDLTTLGRCNRDHASGFGYNDNAPCLYLRLSKVCQIHMRVTINSIHHKFIMEAIGFCNLVLTDFYSTILTCENVV